MTTDQRIGLFLILIASAGYAIMPTLVKTIYANSSFEPMDIALWRFIIATPLTWILVVARRWLMPSSQMRGRLPIRGAMILGFILALAALSAFFGLERLPASTFVVLFYTYPAIVVIFSFLLGEMIQRMAWFALALALLGVAMTVPDFTTANAGDIIGVGFAFANAGLVAFYFLVSKRALSDGKDVLGTSAYILLATLCALLFLIPIRGIQMPTNTITLLSLMTLAAFCTVLPVFAVNQGIQKIGASQASLISTAEPVMSMVVAMILLGEIILPIQWMGAALIIGSVILLQLRPSPKAKVKVATEANSVL